MPWNPKLTKLLALLLLSGGAAWQAWSQRTNTARCPAGGVARGPRCCPEGQTLDMAHPPRCMGTATRCPLGLAPVDSGHCVAQAQRVAIAGGRVLLGPNDWEAQGTIARRWVVVSDFYLDSHEVSVERYDTCARAGRCAPHAGAEPGLPVTQLSASDALRYCTFAHGRLPRADEWVFAATTLAAWRYPWGPTGLVCRRAAFGLVRGPCGYGAEGPDAVGMRPDGRTPNGLYDLVGNVAEWVSVGHEYRAAGGSYQSRLASELKAWAVAGDRGPAPWLGFRCAYD